MLTTETCLFCQNNDIKVRIFWTVFVFTWVLVEPESFFYAYLSFGTYYKELQSSLSKSEHHHPAGWSGMPQNSLEGFPWSCWAEMRRDTLLAEVLFLLEALPS